MVVLIIYIYQFIKPFLDEEILFEEYGALKFHNFVTDLSSSN